MNTKTASRIICKLLALGLALASPIGSPAKVGEQENWYLAKEVQGGVEVNSRSKAWKDPLSSEWKILSVGGGNFNSPTHLKAIDFSGNVTNLSFDAISEIYDFVTLSDGSLILFGRGADPAKAFYHVVVGEGNASEIEAQGSLTGSIASFAIGKNGKMVASGSIPDPLDTSLAPSFIPYFQVFQLEIPDGTGKPNLSLLDNFSIPYGTAPGQVPSNQNDIQITFDDRIVIPANGFLNFFSLDGKFLKRVEFADNNPEVGPQGHFVSTSEKVVSISDQYGERMLSFSPADAGTWETWETIHFIENGDLLGVYGSNLQLWKRAYRTKGLPTPNVIPQPVVRSVAQRPGTNILDIDFEILDSDDATATAGLVASVNGNFDDLTQLIVPTAWTDGTESKIGAPIATNQVHRVSWYVKGDWEEQTGDLKIGVLARDARRTKPVDLHFLELQLEEGALTISRSPLKDSDISNFLLYELAKGSSSLSLQYGKIMDPEGKILAENGSGGGIICTAAGRDYFMSALGYRWATIGEVAMAKEAVTPGTVNQFAATNQVKPRNLPGKVNEYGFDVGDHGARAWWVVKASSLPTQ